jgi:hypothetical protein
MHNAKLAISAAFVLLLGCSSAQSSTVTFDFTGTVSSVDPNLSSAFAVGNPITGSYTFDTAAPNTVSGNPNVGIYNSSFAYTVSAGGFTSSGTGFGFNVFYNLFLASNAYRDQYRVALGSTGPSVNGLAYNGLSLDLFTTSTTPSSTPLASNALPSTPPAIDDFAMNLLSRS